MDRFEEKSGDDSSCDDGRGVELVEDSESTPEQTESWIRRKLIACLERKFISFEKLPLLLRGIVSSINDEVRYDRKNLSDKFLKIPFLQGDGVRSSIAGRFGSSRAKNVEDVKVYDWQDNPRYKVTRFLGGLADVIEENLDKDYKQLVSYISFYIGTTLSETSSDVDYFEVLREIGFPELLTEAVVLSSVHDQRTVVLALRCLLGHVLLNK